MMAVIPFAFPSSSSSCSLFLTELPIWLSGFLPGLLVGLLAAWGMMAGMERELGRRLAERAEKGRPIHLKTTTTTEGKHAK